MASRRVILQPRAFQLPSPPLVITSVSSSWSSIALTAQLAINTPPNSSPKASPLSPRLPPRQQHQLPPPSPPPKRNLNSRRRISTYSLCRAKWQRLLAAESLLP